MSPLENAIETALVLLAPIGIVYGWWFVLARMNERPRGWRNIVSITALALITGAVAGRFAMGDLMPSADWSTGAGVAEQMSYVKAWYRPIFLLCSSSLVLGLAGRPRLIGPISAACIGTALLWVLSTQP